MKEIIFIEVKCDGLNMKCLPSLETRFHTWFPTGGDIWGSCGTFRRWRFNGRSGLLGVVFEVHNQALIPALSPVSFSMRQGRKNKQL